MVFRFKAVFADELRELGEVAFIGQHSTAQFRLGHHSVKMGRYNAIGQPTTKMSIFLNARERPCLHRFIFIVHRYGTKGFGEEDFDMKDIVQVAFLSSDSNISYQ